ncbi:glycine/D-amino acid oxidase-like deaminating enzyme [Amycolatopsis bartoniae]|uniref:Oxidoreductase n=1 Tax=Amycolatopsis bartoniae TaxID=941986 RepID=A0A8H9IV52_9PSEU|nr:FAD-dependent oxidoreductase [Amycolatopsis bartoniae]MBB2937023.1 glycine/D-amino acid oxidase-like deaminating enzyme [Amycolatopsis bartoniae]TVT01032.1 FAD-binding oxidoreductase [Amycolatopsis bartoniae]GHF51896.1 oxidoreductase [Amycolatopsis bartoniae]
MDVVVVGAGMVGAACAYFCAAAGLRVAVVDRGGVAGGTTSGGEGNILVSDKEPGPELDLALRSVRRWRELGERFGPGTFELEPKGGVVVAQSPEAADGLAKLAAAQRESGVEAQDVSPAELFELEPNLTREVVSGVFYPQDMQVQPMLTAAQLLRQAKALGATVHTGTEVRGFRHDGTKITAVETSAGVLSTDWVVNAAGTWGGEVAALAGAPVPVLPRRGFVLVTEPLPRVVRHKVYTADYVANVASGDEGLETSVVVEGTAAGTVLIGASRERVGFDRTFSLPVVRKLAAQAIGVFPFLADVGLLRSYLGFRPYCPDHLPVIGLDPRVPGLLHACGHEGAGIGLAAATGELVAQVAAGKQPDLDLTPFRPDRFEEVA